MLNQPSHSFCKNCGHATEHRIPDDGDVRLRAICPACHTIHYDNPLNVVGCIAFWPQKPQQIVLCQRNIEPRKGKWTLPAGFMELGETLAEAACRETFEEAGVELDMGNLFSIIDVVHAGQVHFFYLAQLKNEPRHWGSETIEARLFSEENIPWDEIAFKTVKVSLKQYFQDLKTGFKNPHFFQV